jgi:hypothetical protein
MISPAFTPENLTLQHGCGFMWFYGLAVTGQDV